MAEQDIIDPRDQKEINAGSNPERREVIRCTITTYRKPDRVNVGDPVPQISVHPVTGGGAFTLSDSRGRPTVLIFGSYT